jgi:hypothetical protein
MNKLLRFSFVALMMMLFSGLSATEITILPSDAEPTEGADYSVTKGGVTMYVTASTVTDSQFRIFKGQTITFVGLGEKITKVVFTCTAEGDAKYGPGSFGAVEGYTYEGKVGTWTGYAQTLIFTAESNQVRATQIVVTLGEGGDTPDNPDPTNDLLSKFQFNSGTFTDNGNQTTFDFTGVAVVKEQNIDVTGNFLFDFENEICTACTANLTFSSEIIAMLAEADAKANAEEDGFASVSRNGATLTVVSAKDFLGYSRILIKSMLKIVVDNEEGGYGILEAPLSPNLANVFAGSLDSGQTSEEDFFIKGKIAAIKYEFSAQYGTATFFISIDGQNDFTFQCYSVYYLENKPWVEGNTQIKVGDEVIICGKLVNYNGNTPETASKKAYIYSLNGKTKEEGGTNPNPQVTTATCAEVLAGADGTIYRVTGKCVEIANTTYGNWYLEDATGKVYIYGTLDAEGNTKNFASLGIEVGDEITVEGPRKTYKETVELVDVKVIEIKKAAAEGAKVWDFTKWSDATIANLKADAAASKTSGWSDVEKKADAEAGADPTEASKDNCFWLQLEAAPADGALTANGVVIEELKGLKFDAEYAAKRSLAIAVNYPSTSLGDYAGPAYLWLGGGGSKQSCPCFTIPGVKAGSKITFEMESHKPSDARGIGLYKNSYEEANLIGEQFKPTAKATNTWDITEDCDVVVWNTSGCHIYKIEVTSSASGIQAVKTVKVDNGFIYNLAGQRVDANYKGVVIKNGQKMIQK